MSSLQIVDWLAVGEMLVVISLGVLSLRLTKKLAEFQEESPEFLKVAVLPALTALGLVAYGGFGLVMLRMPIPGGSELDGPVAIAAGAVLVMAGFALEAMIFRNVRRVQSRGRMAVGPTA